MNFMKCTTCNGLVTVNATGVCLACQMQNGGILQEDEYTQPFESQSIAKLMQKQKEIEEKLANANEITSTEKVDACKQAKDGKKVGSRNSKRNKTSQKKGKIHEK